jgi:ATP-dependent Clp protease adaptor protein ClpS
MHKFGIDLNEEINIKEYLKVTPPPLFKVLLLNDDYTTMEFVIHILEKIFHKQPVEASQIMLHVHKNGRGLAGIYTREIAETKIEAVHEMAELGSFPLRCVMEKE